MTDDSSLTGVAIKHNNWYVTIVDIIKHSYSTVMIPIN